MKLKTGSEERELDSEAVITILADPQVIPIPWSRYPVVGLLCLQDQPIPLEVLGDPETDQIRSAVIFHDEEGVLRGLLCQSAELEDEWESGQ